MKVTDLIKSFKQGKRGNCVSIAVIKAAIGTYGLDGVFKNVDITDEGNYQIEMKDSFKLTLRKHEINKAAKYSRFLKGESEDIREKAYFYFAAMAKRVLVEGKIDVFSARNTLRNALRSLNNGENYLEGVEWLGLLNNYKKVSKTEINNYKHIIGVSAKHCYYISEGFIDNYGKPIEMIDAKSSFRTKTLIVLN